MTTANPYRVRRAVYETPQAGEAIVIIVYGVPGPQGSHDAVGDAIGKNGQRYTRLKESSAKVKPWRADVVAEALRVMDAMPYRQRSRFPLGGPLEASMHFTVPAPKDIPAERVIGEIAYPMCKPDLSKYLRATEDALTDARVWKDDGLAVAYRGLAKHYPNNGPHALDAPGAVIRIWQLGAAA